VDVEALSGGWGAVIGGTRVSCLDDEHFARLLELLRRDALVVLPGQYLDDREQIIFSRRFGRLERLVTMSGAMDMSGRELTVLTNRARTNETPARARQRSQLATGNELWHSDSSFKPVQAKVAVLGARVVPHDGGHTEFADMRAAYDALGPGDRRLAAGLRAVHDYEWSQRVTGVVVPDAALHLPPVTRPLVSLHLDTGRSSLLLGRHVRAIVGMADNDAQSLLSRLLEHGTSPPFVYRHQWAEGDLVVWDNRCLLHRVLPWPADQARAMARTTVAGDGDNQWAF
jgi:alpha-ketoglutarate-dependent 2,4-dichlorophenoxyacetate dioxygenase